MVTADVALLAMSPVHCRRVCTTTREGMLEIYREIPFIRQVQVINNLPFTGPSTCKQNCSVYKPPPFINSPGSDIRPSLLFQYLVNFTTIPRSYVARVSSRSMARSCVHLGRERHCPRTLFKNEAKALGLSVYM